MIIRNNTFKNINAILFNFYWILLPSTSIIEGGVAIFNATSVPFLFDIYFD